MAILSRYLNGFRFDFDMETRVVWVYTKTQNLGGFYVDRYAEGHFGSAWMRAWIEDNAPKG